MTAKLHVLPVGNLTDVARQLRVIADEIEQGIYGEVMEGALTVRGHKLEVFGLGRSDATVTHYMLCCAAAKMQAPGWQS